MGDGKHPQAQTRRLHTRCFIWSCRYARPRAETAAGSAAAGPPAIALVAEIRATLRIIMVFICLLLWNHFDGESEGDIT
jgi:hypothetical protein